MPNIEDDQWPAVPAVVNALKKMIEELQLQTTSVVGVEVGPVFESVQLKPFLLRGHAHEPFDVSAQMKSVTSPVAGG